MLRRLLILSAAVVALVIVVVAGAAYWFLARDGFRQALESQATSWLGQPVRIGAARAQFLPRLAVSLRNIRVGEPAQLTLEEVDLDRLRKAYTELARGARTGTESGKASSRRV